VSMRIMYDARIRARSCSASRSTADVELNGA
jgi:hypothetical protein